jgi:hypothetical protein
LLSKPGLSALPVQLASDVPVSAPLATSLAAVSLP